MFSQEEYTSGVFEMARMSACRVTAQYPSSSNPAEPRRCATHQTGAARRSSASSSAGTLITPMSGSVKSKPGGMSGAATVASLGCQSLATEWNVF